MRKPVTALNATIILLLLSVVFVTPALSARIQSTAAFRVPIAPSKEQAELTWEPALANAQPTTDAAASAYLPMVATAYHPGRQPCSEDSPFGIQIAALHQVVRSEPAEALTQAEAEWLARYDEGFADLTEALEESGACWTRVRIDWALIQPEPPPADYRWGPYHDDKLRQVAETGVHIIAHVDNVPEWAAEHPFGPIQPDRLDDFTQFLTDLVNRYKQPPYNINHWELFNEPDRTFRPEVPDGKPCNTWPGWGCQGEEYAKMLAASYQAIKAADPAATVLMGGVAQDWFLEVGGPFHRYFPDEVIEAAGAGDNVPWDVSNVHYFPDFRREWERWDPNSEDRIYGWLPAPTCGDIYDGEGKVYAAGGTDLIAKVSHFTNRLRTCFGVEKPLWVTELGEHGYPYDPDNPDYPDDPYWSIKQQARYVIQGYARGLAAGAEKIVWFVLVSPPYDYQAQGLLYQEDWSPKPAFRAYQTLTSELGGYRYSRDVDVPNVEGYVFLDAAFREKTVAWGNVHPSSSASVPLTLAPVTRLRVADHLGAVALVEDGGAGDADGTKNGAIQLQLTADPVFVSW
jgi:hypothetical protein